MRTEVPFGVKYCRGVNIVSMIILAFLGIWATMIATPVFTEFIANNPLAVAGTKINILKTQFGIGIFMTIFYLIPVIVLFFLNRGLSRLGRISRISQIIVSFLFLFLFPIGTILYGISLYYMLFDKKTREIFIQKA